jgi:hypothetical protein
MAIVRFSVCGGEEKRNHVIESTSEHLFYYELRKSIAISLAYLFFTLTTPFPSHSSGDSPPHFFRNELARLAV